VFAALYQIAKNTFRESVREPIYLLVLLSALCLIGIYPIFTLFVFREQVKLVVDSAMATTTYCVPSRPLCGGAWSTRILPS